MSYWGFSFIILSLWACGNTDDQKSEIYPQTEIYFSGLPDSVKVETTAEFNFSIQQQDYTGIFELDIDTIIPVYKHDYWIDWSQVPEGVSQIPQEAIINLCRKGIDLTINDNPLAKGMTIQAGRENRMTFANPRVVGDYRIIFNIRNNRGQKTKKELSLKVYSPSIKITVYDIDPWLDLGIYDKNFYEELNKNYSYSPLSEVFQNKETDVLYSHQQPKPGYPGELTFPGIGVTICVVQENAKDFLYSTDESNIQNAFGIHWDNDVLHSARTIPQKAGFHCLEFDAKDSAVPGVYSIELSLTDYWGKKQKKLITVNATAYNGSDK